MGAKTALLAFTKGDLRPALRGAVEADPAEVLALVRGMHPGYDVTPIADGVLGDDIYPPDDTSFATVLTGAELFCDRRLVCDRPSQLPARLLRAAGARRIIMHGMHSVSDWLCFAVWENGALVRSLSVSPDGGVVENIGEPYDFERPYWAGERPVGSTLSGDPYSLPGLMLDAVVLWNTRYIDLAVNVLRGQGYPVRDEDAARLSPLGYAHINMFGRSSFPAPSTEQKLRPLRDPDAAAG